MNPPYRKIIVLFVSSVIILGCSIGLMVFWDPLFHSLLKEELILAPTSKSFKIWQKTPVPMHLEIYLWNWTNHEQFGVNKSSKPHFVERGPYVFKEIDTKLIKGWNNNGTVTFGQRKDWQFAPELSNGSLSDNITNLNPIAATIAYKVRFQNIVLKDLVDIALAEFEKITVTKSVRELLFDGYSDRLLKIGARFNFSDLPFDKFGWFYGRNGSETYDGTFNMLTGETNLYTAGLVDSWNFESLSHTYPSCQNIEGSIGDFWPPLLDNQTISIFSPDVCTTLNLEAGGVHRWLGLSGSEFVSTERMLDNGTKVPERKCYCDNIECQPSGVMNVSACKFGAPAFISLPHFHLADDFYLSKVDGMRPNEDDHHFSIVIEPTTGIPLQVHAAMQINMLVRPDPHFGLFKNVPETYIPMLWFKQTANLTQDFVDEAKIVLMAPTIAYIILGGFSMIGIVLSVIALVIFLRHKFGEEENQILIVPNE